MSEQIIPTVELRDEDSQIWLDWAEAAKRVPFVLQAFWFSEEPKARDMEPGDRLVADIDGAAGSHTALYYGDIEDKAVAAYIRFSSGSKSTQVKICGETWEACQAFLKEIRESYPPAPRSSEDGSKVAASLHALSSRGPVSYSRKLEVPDWASIRDNYGATEQAALDALNAVDLSKASDLIGRLILLYGEPGTGKTYAIRALMRSWRHQANFRVVLDSEKLFSDPSYMLEVVLGEDEWATEENTVSPWNILVIEDNSEIITADARERVGQQLSRLLNLTDGLTGQGLRFLTIITTNDPIEKIHQAIKRPGRIHTSIEFSPLTSQAAAQWLKDRGVASPPEQAMTLAAAYQFLAAGNGQALTSRKVGF